MGSTNERLDALLTAIKENAASKGLDAFAYKSADLGYLPYCIYHWIEIGDEKLDVELPLDWSRDDLEALVQAGHIERFKEVNGRFMPADYCAYFRFVPAHNQCPAQ